MLDTLQKTNSKNEEMSPGDQGIQEAPDCFPKDRQRQSELSVSNTAVLSVNFLSGLSQHQAAVSKVCN